MNTAFVSFRLGSVLLTLSLCLVPLLSWAQGTGCAPAPSGLVSWWRGEGNGLDSAGANHASLISGAIYTDALAGQGFLFNGVDGRIIVPDSASLNFGQNQNFSIEGWVKTASQGGAFGIMVLLDKRDSSSVGYVFYLDNGLPSLRFSEAGPGVAFSASGHDLRDALYHHVAVAVDRASTNGGHFFVDGQLVSSFDPTSVRGSLANSEPLRIGMNSDPSLLMFYGGVLDELSLYSRALSPADVLAIYNAGASGKCLGAAPPVIKIQPIGQNALVGSNATFTVGAIGTGPLSFQWMFNGSPLTGATDYSLALTNVAPAQAGAYSVQVTNQYGSVLSSNAWLTVVVIAPAIVSQPTNQSVLLGYPATFAVGAEGSPPLFFQWLKDGNPLPGANGVTLTFPSTKTDDAGTYSVVVTNIAGTVLSSNAVLTLIIPPPCVPPPSQMVSWWRGEDDAFDYAGANNASAVDGVTYTNGLVGRAFAFNGINGAIIVPDSPSLNIGKDQNFSMETWVNTVDHGGAYGNIVLVDKRYGGNTGYVWYLSSGLMALRLTDSFASAAFSAPRPDLRDGHYHHLAVTLDRSSVTGGKFYVDGQVVHTFDPTSVPGDLTNPDSFRIGASSDSYAMFYGGVLDELSVYNRSLSPAEVAAIYSAGLGGKCYTPTPPVILTQPGDQIAYLGLNATLSVAAGGSPPLSFQWTLGGSLISGATKPSLLLTGVTAAQAGEYAVMIRNIFGSVTSQTAHVTVAVQPPYIATQPQNVTVFAGQNAAFAVTAGGSPPLSYQWLFKGVALQGATASRLVLNAVTYDQAGAYSVVVTNEAGSATSSNATLRVNFPPATIRVISTSGQSGHTVVVPVVVTANGNENALSLSLNFNRSLLTFAGATAGSDAAGASLLINDTQAGSGRVGLAVALGAGSTLAPGAQQVLLVSFASAVLTTPAVTPVSFGDTPLGRQLADTNGDLLPAGFVNGSVTLAAADLEADVSPRPGGNRAVDISDWVLLGRYAARLDYPTNAAEFQRADCAPRTTAGDGAITVIDWVQAGRYFARLDPLAALGGPTNEAVGPVGLPKDNSPRQVRVGDTLLLAAQTGTVPIFLDAQGDENALGFSVSFDPARLTFQSATAGNGVSGASFVANTTGASSGQLGFLVGVPSGTRIAAGACEVVRITFRAATAAGTNQILMTDQPVRRQVSSDTATELTAAYINGTVAVMPFPPLTIQPDKDGVALSWPGWATNFVLQSAGSLSGEPTAWTNVLAPVTLINGLQRATAPTGATAQYYRLKQAP